MQSANWAPPFTEPLFPILFNDAINRNITRSQRRTGLSLGLETKYRRQGGGGGILFGGSF
jgi:hypothetical protein